MKKFRCTVCGYVYEGDAAPEKCPLLLECGLKMLMLQNKL